MKSRTAIRIGLLGLLMLLATVVMVPQAGAAVLDDDVPGSVLVFTKYNINTGYTTTLRVTNNAPTEVGVHIELVCPGDSGNVCKETDRWYRMTGHETRNFDVASLFPRCRKGYVLVWATDTAPVHSKISHNFLYGTEIIQRINTSQAEKAIAIQAVAAAGTNLGAEKAPLAFDGVMYAQLPTLSYTNFIATNALLGLRSALTLLTLDVDSNSVNTPVEIDIDYWNEWEVPFSSSTQFTCWMERNLTAIDPGFNAAVLGTPTGSMTLTPTTTHAVLGSIEEFAPGKASIRHLYHDLTARSTTFLP